jgi:hypothetical protein
MSLEYLEQFYSAIDRFYTVHNFDPTKDCADLHCFDDEDENEDVIRFLCEQCKRQVEEYIPAEYRKNVCIFYSARSHDGENNVYTAPIRERNIVGWLYHPKGQTLPFGARLLFGAWQ